MSKNKKCASKMVFFNDKKLRKIPMIYDRENCLQKYNFGTFWHLSTTPILKIQYFRLGMLILGKNLSNPRFETP
jgi:hypothetical protein